MPGKKALDRDLPYSIRHERPVHRWRLVILERYAVLPIFHSKLPIQVPLEGMAIGLVLGLIDIHSTGGYGILLLFAYVVAGIALGWRHAGRAWQAWVPLGSSLYLVHFAAIAGGYQSPYVEDDAGSAIGCILMAWPTGLGLFLGAFVRFFDRRVPSSSDTAAILAQRPRARRLTVRRMTGIVAVIALHLAFVRLLMNNDPFFGFCTNYSEGYSERRFNSLRVGMTREEVEAIIGAPLRILPRNQDSGSRDEETWKYSGRRDYTANYWRREVFFENGKVVVVIGDFWFD